MQKQTEKKDMNVHIDKTEHDAKLYGIIGTSYILLATSIAIAIYSFMTITKQNEEDSSTDQKNNGVGVNSIVTKNGFTGTIINNEAVLNTTVATSLLKNSNGVISAATSTDVINYQLTGYQEIAAPLASGNTILQAIGKLLVLQQTKLLNAYVTPTPSRTPVVPSDTIMAALTKLQAQLFCNQFVFSTADNRISANTLQTMGGAVISGVKTIPGGLLKAGCVLELRATGNFRVEIAGAVTQNQMSVNFNLNGTNMAATPTSVNQTANYYFTYVCIIPITINSAAPCYTLNLMNTSSGQTQQSSARNIITINLANPFVMNLSARVITAQTNTFIDTTNVNCSFLFRQL